jgi:hypothetical protein
VLKFVERNKGSNKNLRFMATYSIEVRAYKIITCTQVQTIIFMQRTIADIDAEGNGRIKLSAKNVESAMNLAMELLATYQKMV